MLTRHGQARRGHGVTLVELLVALAISLIFVGSVAFAFVQIIRAADEVEAVVRAHQAARGAVDAISRDLRQLQLDPNPDFQQMVLINRNLPYGDNIDNDGDGRVDEEFFNGYDQDGDWVDHHATFGGFTERAKFVGVPDHGDIGVDEDCVFSADEITFIMPASVPTPFDLRRRITYRLGTFDGQEHVLLRIVQTNPVLGGGGDPEVVEPLAFDVVSLDILGWNANSNWTSPVPETAYWTSTWDANQIFAPLVRPLGAGDDPNAMPFKFPAAFLVSVVVNAERRPLSEISDWPFGGRPLKTVRMTTIVNVESVIIGADYQQYLRD